jgi:hypothetical protein
MQPGTHSLLPRAIPRTQLPECSREVQVMENPGFLLKPGLNPSANNWASDLIFAFMCGLGLFFLLIPYLQRKPY